MKLTVVEGTLPSHRNRRLANAQLTTSVQALGSSLDGLAKIGAFMAQCHRGGLRS